MSSKSSNSLDKVPVKQSRKGSKAPSHKSNKSQQRVEQDKQNSTINQSLRKEIDNLVNQSSLLLGSINQGIGNNSQSIVKEDPRYQQSINKLQNVNFELDEMLKMTGALANKFSKRDNQVQVVQNFKTGELLSQIDKALGYHDKMQDAKSVQASFINPYIGNKQMKSGVSSVVRGVPSDNPLSNEVRMIMKHEGIQTDQKENQSNQQQAQLNLQRAKSLNVVPKLQLPQNDSINQRQQSTHQQQHNNSITRQNITQDSQIVVQKMPQQSRFVNRVPNKAVLNQHPNFNQSINQIQNNFMQTRGSMQGYKNYTYQPPMVKPKLMIQDFYRQNQTNISCIQEQIMPRTLASNQSYINVYEQQKSQGQSMLQPQPYIQSFQNTFNPQRDPVNTYHHQIRDTQSQRDNARILDGISTGRFSMNTQYQHQNFPQQPINNLGKAINILMK